MSNTPTDKLPEFDPAPEGDEGPEMSKKRISRLALIIGIVVMLIPAGVPVYFALNVEGTAAILLFATGGAVALVNILLVFGFYSWVNSLQSDSSDKSDSSDE